jgi:hypothetical protein
MCVTSPGRPGASSRPVDVTTVAPQSGTRAFLGTVKTRARRCLRRLNSAAERRTGFAVRKVSGAAAAQSPAPAKRKGRLVPSPVFLLAPVRSGSTLLRLMLDSHSEICSPHELHLNDISVAIGSTEAKRSMQALRLQQKDLEYLLWDRVLYQELAVSGKRILVEKTPGHVMAWRRLAEGWPQARFMFLLRHPVSIAQSWQEARSCSIEQAADAVARYCDAVDEARESLSGLTLRYEDLVADPETVTRAVCDYIGVAWEPQMLSYRRDEGNLKWGLGDWKDKIRTGQVVEARPLPGSQEVPERLRELCARWGYLPEDSTARVSG